MILAMAMASPAMHIVAYNSMPTWSGYLRRVMILRRVYLLIKSLLEPT